MTDQAEAAQELGGSPAHGWRWRTSRTGSWLNRFPNYASTAQAVDTLTRTGPPRGPGQVTIVVDREDNAEFARAIGRGCRRRGRFVVHSSPRHSRAARAQLEVLRALGKHWDWAAQGGTVTLPLLVRAWLRAERARDVIVLRAHHIHGPALEWLITTAFAEGLRLWLIAVDPLPEVDDLAAGPVRRQDPSAAVAALADCVATDGNRDDPSTCRCEDLGHLPPATHPAGLTGTAAGQISAATTRRIRLLYDIQAAALAAAAAILGCPRPDTLATHHTQGGLRVATDGASMTVAGTTSLSIPEHAQALLRGWAGESLLPAAWAHDVTSTYLTLRLEDAERHTGLRLLPAVERQENDSG